MTKRIKFTKRRVRVSVSTLMLLVAGSACGIFSYLKFHELRNARERYLAKAYVNAVLRRSDEKELKKHESNPEARALFIELIHHHSALEKKYTKAARFPWIAVEPDPPRPDFTENL